MPRLLTALRDHLISNGIVRDPSVAGAAPPMWLEKQTGTPAPGEGANATEVGDPVVGAYLTGGIAPAAYASWVRNPIVELRLRGSKGYMAEDLELAISKQLIDRRDFTMGGLYVVECEQWTALQRLGSDTQGFEHSVAYLFILYRP